MSGKLWIRPAVVLAAAMFTLVSPGQASTTGFEGTGNPFHGLLATIAILLGVVAFAIFYLYLERLIQRLVDRKRERNDVDGLILALGSGWLGARAARALAEIGDEKAVDPLIGALDSRYPDTREAAADALGEIGDERAVEQLARALGDRCASVREHARASIEKIRSRPATNSSA